MARATVGTLVATLTAHTKPYERGMKRAAQSTRTFSQGLARMSKVATTLGAAALTAAAFAMQRMVRSQLQAIDSTTKMARSLGFATEQLIGLQHAAGIAGVEQKELSTALRRLQKNVSDATLGLSTAIRAFDSLHLSAQNLIGLTPHKAFLLVADALSKMTNPMERTRVALDLFGRSGVKLIEMMKGGAAGLEAMQREAEALGLTFTDLEGRRIEAANDAILRMKQAFTALVRTLTIDFAPKLEEIANTIRAMAPQIATLVKQVLIWTTVLVGLAAALKLAAIGQAILLAVSGPKGWAILAASVAVAAAAVAGIVIAYKKATDAAAAFRKANGDLVESTKSTAQQIAAVTKAIEERIEIDRRLQNLIAEGIIRSDAAVAAFERSRTKLRDLNEELGRLKQQLVTDEVNQLAAAFVEQTQAITGNTFALQLEALARAGATVEQIKMLEGLERELELRKKLASDVALATRLIEQALTPLARFIRDKDRLLRALKDEGITQDQYNKALEQLAKNYREAAEAGKGFQEQIEGIAAATATLDASSRRGDFRQVQSFKRTLGINAGDRVGAARRTAERKILERLKRFDDLLKDIRDNQREPVLLKWEG